MTNRLRILIAEDVANDAELEVRELKRAGIACDFRRVDTEIDYRRELDAFNPEVILSDFSMPHFDGMEALAIVRQSRPDIPFIFVSGTIGEEYAVRALRGGATDYVLKNNLIRLPASVERSISEVQERRARLIAERKVRESEAGLSRAQTVAKLAHIITGEDGAFETWSNNLPELLGVLPEQVPVSTRAWLSILHPEDREYFRSKSIEAAVTGGRVDVEYRLRHASGQWIYVRQVIEPLIDEPNATPTGQWFCTLQDVTNQKEAEDRIKRLNRVYSVLSGINGAIVRIRDRNELLHETCRIAVANGGFIVGWMALFDSATGKLLPVAHAGLPVDFGSGSASTSAENGLVPRGAAEVALREKRPVFDNDMANKSEAQNIEIGPDTLSVRRAAIQLGAKSVIVLPLFREGEAFGLLTLYAPERNFFDDDEITLLTELSGDISFALTVIEKDERLNYLAYYDALTGLPNRSLFIERFGQQLHDRGDQPGLVAVALMDVEHLRLVNDTMGRQAGDEVLRLIARRLEAESTTTNFSNPARIVGDMFAVVVHGMHDSKELALAIKEGMKGCFGVPFLINEQELRIDARVGVSTYPADGLTVESLLQKAEAALRNAKSTTERLVFYASEMTAQVAEFLVMETKLHKAIELNQFVLHYQPKFETNSRRITGVEALIRWNDPETGMVPPLQFIGILEDTGMIFEVGRWALRQALADQQRWRSKGRAAPRVAVNVSARQIRDPLFVHDVQLALASQEGQQPALELEITESLLMEDIERNIDRLKTLRKLGVTIAMDDFGTGYSSLSYLARLPMDTLKIDRSFVVGMAKSKESRTIVSTIISLAHSLGLKVVAEGVETAEQLDLLKSLNCNEIQGFYLGRPVPSEEIARAIAS